MKLRRNVLQPLRLELDQRSIPSAASASVAHRLDRSELPCILKNAFASETRAKSLRFEGRPTALLKEYSEQRQASVAGQLFRTANRIHATVDTVVVLCQGSAGLGAKAIVDACCQPYWNHLSRADRGSKPRMFFLDDQSDNDTIQGLLHLLECHRPTRSNSNRDAWALMILGAEDSATEKLWQLEALLAALQSQVANDDCEMSQRLLAVAPDSGSIHQRLSRYGAYDFFPSYEEEPALQCFGPLGLLPATLLGVNIMELLAGSSWMSQHFRQATQNENLVLRFMDWLAQAEQATQQSDQLRIWNPGLAGWRRWYRDLLHAALFDRLESSPPTKKRTPPLPPISPSGEIHVVIERPRFDPIRFEQPTGPTQSMTIAGPNPLADPTDAQQLFQNGIDQRMRSVRDAGRAVAEIRLGELDELHTGQWLQFMLLVTASSRILGVQPPAADSLQLDMDHGPESTA